MLCVASQRLLAGCPLGPLTRPTGTEAGSGCPVGPLGCPGEDSSVLQLLVLTPTEESKGCPGADPPTTHGQCRWSLAKPATRVKLRNAADFLLRVKVPYFIIMVSIFEVSRIVIFIFLFFFRNSSVLKEDIFRLRIVTVNNLNYCAQSM